MGNKVSITINFDGGDDTAIVAGSTLQGNVVLRVDRKLNPTNLILHLIGKETTMVSKATKGSYRDQQIIARAMTTLRDAKRLKVQRGVYTIPFQFVLPASLPSSTQFPRVDGRSYNGKIEYRLRAQLGDTTEEKIFVVESAPLSSDVVPCMVRPSTHELKRLGVLNKGCLSVGASVENSRIGRGHTLKVNVASRNETTMDIVRVRLKLIELIDYRAQDLDDTTQIDLEKLKDIDLPGLVKGRTNGNNMKRNQKGFDQKVESTYKAIYRDLLSGESQLKLVVPKRSRDSYHGNLMTISHFVLVTFFTKSMMDNPEIKIPIVIGNAKDTELVERKSQRAPKTQMATVLVDEDIPEAPDSPCDDESTITVGTNAVDIPVADAIFWEEAQAESLLDNVSGMKSSDKKRHRHRKSKAEAAQIIPMMPSAPSESLLGRHAPPRNFNPHVRDFGGNSMVSPRSPPDSPQSSSQSSASNDDYSRYRMHNSQFQRPIRADYSYEDSDISNSFRDSIKDEKASDGQWSEKERQHSKFTHKAVSQPKHPPTRRDAESLQRLNRLIHELRGSIHDYEVIVSYARFPEYRTLYSSLTPIELGVILRNVNMNHQVKVARLLARQMAYAQAFSCEHCAEAVIRTSEYFRSNMVEALLPFCEDLTTNRHLIQSSLSEWERLVTHRLFDGLYEC